MDRSNRQGAISAAGKLIERELGLLHSVDTLARWMVYRFAELRETAENASNEAKRESAKTKCDQLVMDIWAQRASMPGRLNPNRRFEPAIQALERLVGEVHPWDEPRTAPTSALDFCNSLESAVRKLSVSLVMLDQEQTSIGQGLEDPDLPLDDEEQQVREMFAIIRDQTIRRCRSKHHQFGNDNLSSAEVVAMFSEEVVTCISDIRAILSKLQRMVTASLT